MNKTQLIDATAEQLHCPREQARRLVETVIAQIEAGLQRDGKVVLTGFGTFRRVVVKERTGHNPTTGEALTIPAGARVRFRASPRRRELDARGGPGNREVYPERDIGARA